MFKFKFIKICVFVFALCLVKAKNDNKQKMPNIIMIVADDMGFDDVSFRGPKEFITPNIDALAYHGRILNRMYAVSMCTPSRAALLTGKYPIHTATQHFVIGNHEPWGLPFDVVPMSLIFQSVGYSTNLIGKWHLGLGKAAQTPTYRGFDYHYGYWGGYIDYYSRKAQMFHDNFSIGYDFRRNLDLECGERDTYVTDLLTNEAERVILKHKNSSQPLFLMVNHLAPHIGNKKEPLQAPPDEVKKFQYISNPKRRIYAAMVSRLDQSIGRITQALDQADLLQNSIIVFLSDNGAPSVGFFSNSGSNWPLRGQKNSPWEGGIRVAGAIWSPLIAQRGTIFEQPIYIGDWLPTLASAANVGLDFDLNLDGINLWSALVSATDITNENREIVHNIDDIFQTVSYMKGAWKYINGTTINGTLDGTLTQREQYEIDPRENHYAEEILNSMTSKTLKRYDQIALSKRQIKNLRATATVNCGQMQRSCNALVEECLFNILNDPCEQNNLVYEEKYRNILNEMRENVENYRRSAEPPGNKDAKPENDPARHNCIWTNFVDIPATEYTSNCDVYDPCEKSNDKTKRI